ncbi:MAG TPA: glycosyltransferase [Armatimonadota bacterium]|jgi:GT2 family glycosyltransferase
MKCTVIISAYNNFSSLQRALWGYEVQTHRDFDIIIADDGSDDPFCAELDQYIASSSLRIAHLWHRHKGFHKCTMLNAAICATQAEYLIFTDGDIIPRDDFVANHLRLARPGCYLTGGSPTHCNIPQDIHQDLTREEIQRQIVFDVPWLQARGITSPRITSRVAFRGFAARICDLLTPRWNAFVGCNASVYREDILAVRGFDETFSYGGLDRDLGVRLANNGIRGIQNKYSLCGVHLAHARPYRDEKTVAAQKWLINQRRRWRTVLPLRGIDGMGQPAYFLEVAERTLAYR